MNKGKVSKQKALELLEERIKELDLLPSRVSLDDDLSEFNTWYTNTKNTIKNIFHESKYLDFDEISFSLNFLVSGMPDYEFIKAHNNGRKNAKSLLLAYIKEIKEFWEDDNVTKFVQSGKTIELSTEQKKSIINKSTIKERSKDIFIVHGHDDGLVAKVQLFLTKIKLNGIVLHEQANLGKVILEKLEHYTNVDFAIVLYTPCDLGKAKEEEELRARARQNVVFEHGYLMGRLGRRNVAFLVDGIIETPGDISGAVYSSVSNHWQFEILKELKAVGYDVDANNLC